VSLDRRRTPPRMRGGVPELGVGLCEGGAWVRLRCMCSANAATGRRGLTAVQPKTRPAFVVLGLRLGWAGALGRRPNVPKAREAIRPAKGGSRVSPKDLRVEHPSAPRTAPRTNPTKARVFDITKVLAGSHGKPPDGPVRPALDRGHSAQRRIGSPCAGPASCFGTGLH